MPPSLSSSASMAAFIIAEVEQLCSLLRFVISSFRASKSPIRAEYIRSSIASNERDGGVAMMCGSFSLFSPVVKYVSGELLEVDVRVRTVIESSGLSTYSFCFQMCVL